MRVSADTLTIHTLTSDSGADGSQLASHARAKLRGSWVIDSTHWAGLPDGHTRAVTTDPTVPGTPTPPVTAGSLITEVLARHRADIPVATRPLSQYATAAAKENLT